MAFSKIRFTKKNCFILFFASLLGLSLWNCLVMANPGNSAARVLPLEGAQLGQQNTWSSYALVEEGDYILKLNVKYSPAQLVKLAERLQVLIPEDSIIESSINQKASGDNDSTGELVNAPVFLPSEGSRFRQLNILDLLKEEGLNLSIKGKSPIYLIAQGLPEMPELAVYKVGPSIPYPKYKEGSK